MTDPLLLLSFKRLAGLCAWLLPVGVLLAAEPLPPSGPPPALPEALATNRQPVQVPWGYPQVTNAATTRALADKEAAEFQTRLKLARVHRLAREFTQATSEYTTLLENGTPEAIQRTALLELAQMAEEQDDLPRAQQIYAQWLDRWPGDVMVPEVLLRQGIAFRRMGLPSRAVTKFYAVMSSALVLKPDRFDYYQQLVLRAQNEIAETQFELGNYNDAAQSYGRLLRLDYPPVNRASIEHRYIQCLVSLGRRGEAITEAEDFLKRYPDAPERPEVHFLCASALKQAGRNNEALQQVLALLHEQCSITNGDPAVLAYWQRRAGNEIANQFYQEGEPMKALDVYLRLAELDSAPDWQLPVWYQLGLVFERLNQPAKALEYYGKIGLRQNELGTNAAPSLKSVVEMAKWRKDFLGWQQQAELANVQWQAVLRRPDQTNTPALKPPTSAL